MTKSLYISAIMALSCLFFLDCSEPTESIKVTSIRTPAEFESQEAVWMIWPPFDHLEGYSNKNVYLQLVDAILPYTRIKISAASSQLLDEAKSLLPQTALEAGRIELIQIPSVEIWARDMGPNFIVQDNQLKIVDFNFDAWGYADTTEPDTKIEEMYDERVGKLMQVPVITSSLITEGGDREVNGKGTLMVVESVELGRNPHLTKEQIDQEFKRVLGVSKVIWLKQGLYEDDHTFLGRLPLEHGDSAYTVVTTNGHIDEFARFANDSTILLAEVDQDDLSDPIAQENNRRMAINYSILSNATDQDGQPFNIVRIPLPKTIVETMKPGDGVYDYISTLEYEDGSVFPVGEPVNVVAAASYLNFLITNGAVIGQKYWRPSREQAIKLRDEQVKQILEEVFPERDIIMLDALAINFGGGGIHCITMQEPQP